MSLLYHAVDKDANKFNAKRINRKKKRISKIKSLGKITIQIFIFLSQHRTPFLIDAAKQMKKNTRQIGKDAEIIACDFLIKNGLQLLARNFNCRIGEIDLIMQHKSEVVFVEVRKRSSSSFVDAIESVTVTKQRKIVRTALFYLQQKNWFEKVSCRFDIVGLFPDKIEWLQDAFSADFY